MATLTYPQLATACEAGGATALSLVTELAPAGGPHAGVAPARYLTGRDTPAFAYETRFIDGQPAVAVIIDQKQSQLNRVEAAILQSIRDDHPVLGQVPRVQVSYHNPAVVYTDLELPQRIFDGHIRAGTVNGQPVTAHPRYLAARDSCTANARALLELSPGSLVLGCWDSTRRSRQARFRSALVGEIIGVLADQTDGSPRESRRADARIDPVKMNVELTADEIGGTLPKLQSLGVVSCRRIIRTQVLSFAALRQLRFDAGPAGDACCRALLAAYALAGLARSNAELSLPANCDLVEAAPISMKLDARNGEFVALEAFSIDEADGLLESAQAEAKREADIHWRGQVFDITGDPVGYVAARAGSPDGAAAVRRGRWRLRRPAGS